MRKKRKHEEYAEICGKICGILTVCGNMRKYVKKMQNVEIGENTLVREKCRISG